MSGPDTFLSRLSDADRAELAGRWIVRNYRAQEVIIGQGESDRDVFFLLEGRARTAQFTENGREVDYREICPGDIFGELAGIDGKERSASIVALEPTRAARLPQALFREFASNNPTFAWALLEYLSGQVRRLTDRVYEFSTLVVRQRLVCELLRRAEGRRLGDGQALIRPIPTHFELASSISTHREAVSREMSALARRGLVERRNSSLVLCNLAELETLAGRDQDER